MPIANNKTNATATNNDHAAHHNELATAVNTLVAANPVPGALVDVKGDMIAATAPDAVGRLPVGADGQVLSADTSHPLGVRWTEPPTGSITLFPQKRIVRFDSSWDPYLIAGQQGNFEANLSAMVSFEPGAFSTAGGLQNWAVPLYIYQNVHGNDTINPGGPTRVPLVDSDSAQLYLPWPYPTGTPTFYARETQDIRSNTYRTNWLNYALSLLAQGAQGLWIDDVNLDSDKSAVRNGGGAPLTSLDNGAWYTSPTTGYVGWASALADFLHFVRAGIQAQYPNAKLIFNLGGAWFAMRPARWTDPRYLHMIDACDYMNLEFSFLDAGLDNGAGSSTGTDFALRSMLLLIDTIISRGKAFIAETQGAPTAAEKTYQAALYQLKRKPGGQDMIGVFPEHATWPALNSAFTKDVGYRLTYTDAGTPGSITGTFGNGDVVATPVVKTTAAINVADTGRGFRLPVRVAAPANITVATPGATIDGVTMVVNDRVLLANRTTASQNGIYIWTGAAVALTRALDADTAAKLTDSLLVTVDEGTVNRDSIFTLSTNKPITVGTTSLRFTRVHAAYETSSHPPGSAFQPTLSKLENLARDTIGLAAQPSLATGTVRVFPMGVLRAGDTLANINFVFSTASAAITNSWAGIARVSDRVVLAVSATSSATTAINTKKTFTFATPFTADKDETIVGFVMYQATTTPALYGMAHGNAVIFSEAPVVNGTSNTGATTAVAVGATLTAFTAQPQMYYAWCE